jgi:hypothetical protein
MLFLSPQPSTVVWIVIMTTVLKVPNMEWDRCRSTRADLKITACWDHIDSIRL